jgi:hypothetical protein
MIVIVPDKDVREIDVEVGLQKIAAVIGVAVVASSRNGVEYLLTSEVLHLSLFQMLFHLYMLMIG